MKEVEQLNKIILGLRTVLRHKSNCLALLISISNGFLNTNYPINDQVLEYDKKNKQKSTPEQEQKFKTKFQRAKKSLVKIKNELEFVTNEKKEIPTKKITSFRDLPKIIDEQLIHFQEIILDLIARIPKDKLKEAQIIIDKEINELLR